MLLNSFATGTLRVVNAAGKLSILSVMFAKIGSAFSKVAYSWARLSLLSVSGGGLLKSLFGMKGAVGVGFLKKLPIIGLVFGLIDAIRRFKAGDIFGGVLAIGSAVASLFPGIGTALAVGADLVNLGRDATGHGMPGIGGKPDPMGVEGRDKTLKANPTSGGGKSILSEEYRNRPLDYSAISSPTINVYPSQGMNEEDLARKTASILIRETGKRERDPFASGGTYNDLNRNTA